MVISLSSMDIHFLVKEFKILIGSKIEKIFQNEDKTNIFFVLHTPGKGKSYIYFSFPNILCISDFKPEFPDVPPGFCSALRRKITNARIIDVSQEQSERIINFDLMTKKGNSRLIFELFSNGNVILHDEDNKILTVAKSENWGSRVLRPGAEYKYPVHQINPIKLSKEELLKTIKDSDKESLVKTIALDLSLGGTYAEEILFNAKIDKEIKPKEITKEQSNEIYKELHHLFEKEIDAVICDNKPYPIKLNHIKSKNETKFETYSKAISEISMKNLEKKLTAIENKETKEKLSKLDKIITSQNRQLDSLHKAVEENYKKGELIYQHYTEIQKILEIIQSKKSESWAEIKEKLKPLKLFASLDEHNGKLTLNLE